MTELLWALGEIGDERAVEPLIQVLDDFESLVRKRAAEALGKMKHIRAVEPLIQALQDEDVKVRVEAAEALGKIKDERAVDPLLRLVQKGLFVGEEKEASSLRVKAVWALGEIGDQRVLEPLEELLDIEYSKTPEGMDNPDIPYIEQTFKEDEETQAAEDMVEAIREAIRKIEKE
ncbi:MAG: HEAT repeat domain-containing protein [Candidatus Freyarchaeota archaeon]